MQNLGLSGGASVLVRHAHQLRFDHGMDVTLALTGARQETWGHTSLPDLDVVSLSEAKRTSFDIAVATWWETAYQLFEIEAARHAYFVQSLEDRFYRNGDVRRMLAAATHDLPVSFITEARWIADTLREFHPDTPCFYVRNGVDKEVFGPPPDVEPSLSEPLRILIEGHPAVWFKGVGDALEATSSMSAQRRVTLVTPVPWSAEGAGDATLVGPVDLAEMARLYAHTDVVLKMSRVEGMFAPPLEGFHLGATCVVTPVSGHEEYVRHGWNGVVTDWDDVAGAARWLDLLASDRLLLHRLRSNALATARAWPSWRQSGIFMAAALQRIRSLPDPTPKRTTARLLHNLLAGSLSVDVRQAGLERQVAHLHELRAAEAAASNEDLAAAREQLAIRSRQLDDLHRTRAYRTAVMMRAAWKHPVTRVITAPLKLVYRFARSTVRSTPSFDRGGVDAPSIRARR